MIEFLKTYLSRRYPEIAGAYYWYRTSREMRQHSLQSTPYGFTLIGNRSMQNGTFESEETELVLQYLQDTEVFVDIGAHIGYYVCLARSLNKHVIAVEPSTKNLDYLYANLQANGWNDVEVFPLAVSVQSGITTLYGGGTGASLLATWAGSLGVVQQTVAVSTLDLLLDNRFSGCKLMIKIDVEGAEYRVLQGASKTLARSPSPIWLLEICLTEHHPDGINPHFADVFHVFWSHGYQARTGDKDRRIVSPADIERWIHRRNRDFGYVSYLFEKV